METALRTVNALISALFFICYAYQFLYIPLVLAKKQRPLPCPPSPHRYAVLIAARNEAAVIGGLLDSLRQQTYDPALAHGVRGGGQLHRRHRRHRTTPRRRGV